MKKIRSIGMTLIMYTALLGFNACSSDDSDSGDNSSGSCNGVFSSEQECNNAISGVSNCRCEFENDVWIAVPN